MIFFNLSHDYTGSAYCVIAWYFSE